MKYIKKNYHYFLGPLLTFTILMIVYAVNGIYPFGPKSIIQADLGTAYVPVYYNLWDIIHNGNSILYNFDLGSGSNFYGSFVLNCLYSPITWIIGLIPRTEIINFLSYLLAIKAMLMSLTSYICFKKIFKKVNSYYLVMFSVMYALSGYTLLSYHNIIWLDSLIIFPLLILAMKHLYDTGKTIPYILTLSLLIIISYYISYMILLMIVFCGTTGIFLYVKKNQKPKITMKLLLGTLSALLISSFAFLPSFMQSNASMRLQTMEIITTGNKEFFTKLNFYLCLAAPLILYILNLKENFKKDKKKFYFWLLIIIFPSIGLWIEPINAMWHTGSYMCFPYRYGFIPLFILMLGSLNYLNIKSEKENKKNKKEIIKIITVIILLIITIHTFIHNGHLIKNSNIAFGLYEKNVIQTILALALLYIIMYIISNTIKKHSIKYILITLIIITQITTNGILYIGMNYKYSDEIDHTDILEKNAIQAVKDFNIQNQTTNIDRYKDTTASFDENYAYIFNAPTISTWIHIITKEQFYNHINMGYSYNYTKLQDLGGTLFSDAFNHVRYVFSNQELDKNIYTKINSSQSLILYEKDVLPFGYINKNKQISNKKMPTFEYQNMIYKNVFQKSEDIIEIHNPKFMNEQKINKTTPPYLETNLTLENTKVLYLTSIEQINKIVVNDKIIKVPTADNQNNTTYPTSGNCGILELGTYSGKVNIKLYTKNIIDENNIKLGMIDINQYLKFINSLNYKTELEINKNKLNIQVEAQKGDYLLLPITYDKGFEVYVNNKKTEVIKYLNNYMNIPLENGKNKIELVFIPPYLKIGIIISTLTTLIVGIFTYLNKKFHIDKKKKIQYFLSTIALTIYIILFYIIYINPVL